MKRTTLCIVLATIFGIDGQAAWAQSIPQANPEAATTSGPPAAASDQPSTPSAVTLDHITVTGTRTPQKVKDVPGTVTVITSDVLEQEDAQNPTEAIRYEPGVSVGSDQVGRGTQTNFTIRGIGGNRVLLLEDGVEVPDFPGTNLDSGPYALFTRDTVDFDSLKQIEILRGPASALYGSDAIGGTVAYVTKDPSDYLNPINRSWYAAGKLSYDGADRSISETVTAAGRTDALEGLLVVTHRNGSETQVLDASPDPEKYHSENVLGKIVAHISSADSLTLTADALERRTSIDYATDIGFTDLGGGFGYQTIRSTGDDVTRRDRLSLDYVYEAPGAVVERSEVRLYDTQLHLNEYDTQLLSFNPGALNVPTDSVITSPIFQQRIIGADIQFDSEGTLWEVPNHFTYGASFKVTDTSYPQYGGDINLTTGVESSFVPTEGETLPDKHFPDTTVHQTGLFVQDEIGLGQLTLFPALRVDHYALDPSTDAEFENANTSGYPVQSLHETPVSPKLGATYDLDKEQTLFINYAHGYRMPPYDSANYVLDHKDIGYAVLYNPNLRPETSNGVDAGWRLATANGSTVSASTFYNRYSDFIALSSPSPAVGYPLGVYRYINLQDVSIYGAEASTEWRVTQRWTVLGSLAYAYGEDTHTHLPIDQVDPLKVIAGIRYTGDGNRWSSELHAIHAWKHDRVSDPSYFQTPAYTTIDLNGSYRWSDRLKFNIGLFNLTNEHYFISQSVVNVAASTPLLPLYANPGRTVSANMTYAF